MNRLLCKNAGGLSKRFYYSSCKLLMVLILMAAFSPGCGSNGGSDSGSGGGSGGGVPSIQLTLGSVVQYATQNIRISKTAIGDMNGDGLNDVAAIGDLGGIPHILLYFQGNNGTFQLILTIPSPDYLLRGLAIGDFNNDGRDDLLVSAASHSATAVSAGRVLVYYQEPSHSLAGVPQQLMVSSSDVGELCIADLNSDGRKDIAVLHASVSGVPENISFFYQNTDGSADQEFVYGESFARLNGKIRAADMNRDGRNDLVFLSGDSEITVISQLADGTLSKTPDRYAVTGNSLSFFDSIAVGDVNGDGWNDVVAVTQGTPGSLHFFLQNVSGKLDVPVQLDLMQNPPFEIQIADIDGDGLNDMVGDVLDVDGMSERGGHVRVYYQNADHMFSAVHYDSFLFSAFPFSTTNEVIPDTYRSLSAGDVTGDGLRDVIVGWGAEGLFVFPGVVIEDAPRTGLSISGTITAGGAPLEGALVALTGAANKRTTTNASGYYIFSSLSNGSYTITPSKTNYLFSPANRTVAVNDMKVIGQNFIGTAFSISGTVTVGGAPLPGVVVTLGGAAIKKTTTDANGYYIFSTLPNGSYTITPSKTNYLFSPANRTVAINGLNVTGQDFIGSSFTISGTISAGSGPLSGVSVTLGGAAVKTTTTNASGYYIFSTLSSGSYTITPAKTGYGFSPQSRTVSVNSADVAGQDFVGTTFTLSGRITAGGGPLYGVTVALNGAATKRTSTDANGYYTFGTLGNGSYTITPSRIGYSFTPAILTVTVSGADISGQDFIGTTFAISGTITAGGGPLSGVSLTLGGGANRRTTTDANGYYIFNALNNGSYTIKPSRTNYSFSPPDRNVTINNADLTDQNFIGMTNAISGTITSAGRPLGGVTVALGGVASRKTTTDANGYYIFSTLGNGNYTILPSKTGFSFIPASRSVTLDNADIIGQDFIGN